MTLLYRKKGPDSLVFVIYWNVVLFKNKMMQYQYFLCGLSLSCLEG